MSKITIGDARRVREACVKIAAQGQDAILPAVHNPPPPAPGAPLS